MFTLTAASAAPVLGPLDAAWALYRRGGGVVAALTLHRIDDEHTPMLRAAAEEAAACFSGRLALDMSMVNDFTCAWINALLELDRRCWEHGGQLCLFGLRRELHDVLRQTGLDQSLQVRPDERQALAAIGAESTPAWMIAVAKICDGKVREAA
jgi:anti-anti-sigma factor